MKYAARMSSKLVTGEIQLLCYDYNCILFFCCMVQRSKKFAILEFGKNPLITQAIATSDWWNIVLTRMQCYNVSEPSFSHRPVPRCTEIPVHTPSERKQPSPEESSKSEIEEDIGDPDNNF